ncbi:hypothetical protein MCOR18_006881, partial [Pyricularia oryzae]
QWPDVRVQLDTPFGRLSSLADHFWAGLVQIQAPLPLVSRLMGQGRGTGCRERRETQGVCRTPYYGECNRFAQKAGSARHYTYILRSLRITLITLCLHFLASQQPLAGSELVGIAGENRADKFVTCPGNKNRPEKDKPLRRRGRQTLGVPNRNDRPQQ